MGALHTRASPATVALRMFKMKKKKSGYFGFSNVGFVCPNGEQDHALGYRKKILDLQFILTLISSFFDAIFVFVLEYVY